ncbi:MAG: inositol monophosphatase family protein [Kiloniellales bacterium]
MTTRSALINVMAAAAMKAGKALLRDFGEVEQLQVSRKGPADFVSKADLKAERIVRRELTKGRPHYSLLLEESGLVEGRDSSNRWIVDPLDGTANFLHGLPHFAISIGLERDGQMHAGVVYEPIHDELFWAERGAGAYLNQRRLRVSARGQLRDAIFATGTPPNGAHDPERRRVFLDRLDAVMAVSAGVRRWGTASLDLAYVAAGRFDGFWEDGLGPWDMAAGIVLVREAGGLVSEIDGGPHMLHSGSILAVNDRLYEPFGQMLRQSTGRPAGP